MIVLDRTSSQEVLFFQCFFLSKPNPKTDVYDVLTKSDETLIGTIRWFPRWRQYCFFPIADTVYSCGCLGDLTLFLQELKKGAKRS